jgi:hypothetical protein
MENKKGHCYTGLPLPKIGPASIEMTQPIYTFQPMSRGNRGSIPSLPSVPYRQNPTVGSGSPDKVLPGRKLGPRGVDWWWLGGRGLTEEGG